MKTVKLLLVLTLLFVVSCSKEIKQDVLTLEQTLTPLPTQEPCLAGGDQNTINDRLKFSGSEAVLCQGAVFELTDPVIINSARQKIYTKGYPEDDLRAVLRIVSADVTTAILMRDSDDVVVSHIVIDGNRPKLGYKEGEALVYAGGYSKGQVFRAVKITEPRSWSAAHLIEPCTEALVEDSEIGPAGMSDYTWADGISLACTNSIIRNNLIVDATDGAIVIFAATGSLIENNIIRAETPPYWAESTWWNQNFTKVTSPARSYRTISSKLLEQSSALPCRWDQGSGCAWTKEKLFPQHMAAPS
jgi:hypothetical protein